MSQHPTGPEQHPSPEPDADEDLAQDREGGLTPHEASLLMGGMPGQGKSGPWPLWLDAYPDEQPF